MRNRYAPQLAAVKTIQAITIHNSLGSTFFNNQALTFTNTYLPTFTNKWESQSQVFSVIRFWFSQVPISGKCQGFPISDLRFY